MTRDEGIAKMKTLAARHPLGKLTEALVLLDSNPKPSEEERLTRAVIMDVICERCPAAGAAFQAWAEDLDSEPGAGVAVIVAAVRATV